MESMRKKISIKNLEILLAKSAGYCQNPSCNMDLFPYFGNGTYADIREAAHIVSSSPNGPRANDGDRENLENPDNILLLCPNCHSIIDKSPKSFKKELLFSWKKIHEEKIKILFSENRVNTRSELIDLIRKIVFENAEIFMTYGPTKENEHIVISDKGDHWKRNVLSIIIPNNRKLLYILEINFELLSQEEKKGLNKYKLHKDAFEFSYVSGARKADIPLFPKKYFYDIIGE
jgi:hypothetical protein